MSSLYVLIGMAGSGKSTWAREQGIAIVSSDAIRQEILGNEEDQSQQGLVFDTVFHRIGELLKKNQDVIFDATNISMKRRKDIFRRFSGLSKIHAVYFATTYEDCIMNNAQRERKVPIDVIERMYLGLDVPVVGEGWSSITVINQSPVNIDTNPIVENYLTEEEIFDNIVFSDIYQLDQEIPQFHSFTVSEHSWYAYSFVYNNFPYLTEEEFRIAVISAALHDIGKGFTKKWNPKKERYSTHNHQQVGAQKAISLLSPTMPVAEVLEIAELILFHKDARDNFDAAAKKVQRPMLLKILAGADEYAKKGI